MQTSEAPVLFSRAHGLQGSRNAWLCAMRDEARRAGRRALSGERAPMRHKFRAPHNCRRKTCPFSFHLLLHSGAIGIGRWSRELASGGAFGTRSHPHLCGAVTSVSKAALAAESAAAALCASSASRLRQPRLAASDGGTRGNGACLPSCGRAGCWAACAVALHEAKRGLCFFSRVLCLVSLVRSS